MGPLTVDAEEERAKDPYSPVALYSLGGPGARGPRARLAPLLSYSCVREDACDSTSESGAGE